ncbi:hypothetical protein LTR22_007771 [Elasticomyces elasticus]|nr:hypothetical protein LTR22_007771 [Elasticomyces elasticus]KAK5768357.1 hypothetical protein LTS12_001496 [Elasticomyces elasticus]
MERYTVTIITPASSGAPPTLLVPFPPSAIVTAFVDELFKRIARQGLALTPNTHIATLHVDSGAIVDLEDILHDVINSTKDKLYAVFTAKQGASSASPVTTNQDLAGEKTISVRIVTPASAQGKGTAIATLQLPASTTVKQLHEIIAQKLSTSATFVDKDGKITLKTDVSDFMHLLITTQDTNECNCALGRDLAAGESSPSHFTLITSKSKVERVLLPEPNEDGLKAALRGRLGQFFDATKKVAYFGAQFHDESSTVYKKSPVVAVCSKLRHVPAHARTVNSVDEQIDASKAHLLDLHTREIPIHSGSMDVSLEHAGLQELAVAGQPPTVQGDRATAMFLSSLRVFASNVELESDNFKDAVLHVFDLLTKFPPAVRALHLLIHGKTPTPSECAALSHATYEALDRIIPAALVGTGHSRVFEGMRLLCGFILEKSRSLKLADDAPNFPYLAALKEVELIDCKTHEPVMHAMQTAEGLVERIGEGSNGPDHIVVNTDQEIRRLALLSAGSTSLLTTFAATIASDYRYADLGNAASAWDESELTEMHHLSEFCGRNKLAVHQPSQLAGAVAPCLTFDRKAHLAVYTGQEACAADPAKSTLIFRPMTGSETIDPAIIEQLIASMLKRYEADGTAVFDTLGGAAVRRMQSPDEICMFVVDTSASMRGATDFDEVNDEDQVLRTPQPTAHDLTDPDFYGRSSLSDMKETLCKDSGFADMVGIVAEAPHWRRRHAAKQVVELLRTLTGAQIIRKHKELESRRERARANYYLRHAITELEGQLERAKLFWAGLKTHEQAISDFFQFRAQTELSSGSLSQRWTWSLGDDVPTGSPLNHLPSLPAMLVEIPDDMKCPISHTLMQDAVKAADGHTYSRSAITEWFSIRRSSPMTGLDVANTLLTDNREVCDSASAWVDGKPLIVDPSSKGSRKIVFVSPYGTFERRVAAGATMSTVYRLAFRAMAGRYSVFQLAQDNFNLPASTTATVSQRGIQDGERLTIRVADEADLSLPTTSAVLVGGSRDICLVKVYSQANRFMFSYWTKVNTTATMESILWKYWRHLESSGPSMFNQALNTSDLYNVWYGLTSSGDGLLTGTYAHGPENLSSVLTRHYCFGRLGEEKVYREDDEASQDADQPLVFKVKVSKARRTTDELRDAKLSRLDVLKQMFEALINRMLAYNYKTHVGLVTVSSTATLAQSMSGVLENFRKVVIDMSALGDTALWDALALANDQLTQYALKFPAARKRIICISDGADTKSVSQTSHGAYWLLKENDVVLDSISLGDEDNTDLRTASYLLGSYRFHPLSLENALAITEMEPFLSLTERPAITPGSGAPRNSLELLSRFRSAKYYASSTIVNEENMPPRKAHPNLQDDFIELTAAAAARGNASNSVSGVRSNLRMSRILREMQKVAQSASDTASVFVSESDATFWKIVMSGPDGSPYEGGTFLLYFHADEGFPTFAPKARFVTKIKHPNINAHGRICAPIFDRDWTSDTTMGMLIDTVFGLLMQPETNDPINTTATLAFHHDQVEYSDQVREFVSKYASKTKEEWRAELLGEEWADEEDAEEDDVMSDDVDASSDHEMSD